MTSQPFSSRASRDRVGVWLFPGLMARIRATAVTENSSHIKSRREEYRTRACNAQGSSGAPDFARLASDRP
jgi:hypothetical protein